MEINYVVQLLPNQRLKRAHDNLKLGCYEGI